MARDVIDLVTRSIRVSSRSRRTIERELLSHFEESVHDLESMGLSHEHAVRESLSRFGDPSEIATTFDAVHQPNRRSQFGMAVLLASTMLLGAYSLDGTLARAGSAPKRVHVTKHTTLSIPSGSTHTTSSSSRSRQHRIHGAS
jgi:hypothetical protein